MTQADLGLADAYINGDFSFVDKDEGLLNFFEVRLSVNNLNASKCLTMLLNGPPMLFCSLECFRVLLFA